MRCHASNLFWVFRPFCRLFFLVSFCSTRIIEISEDWIWIGTVGRVGLIYSKLSKFYMLHVLDSPKQQQPQQQRASIFTPLVAISWPQLALMWRSLSPLATALAFACRYFCATRSCDKDYPHWPLHWPFHFVMSSIELHDEEGLGDEAQRILRQIHCEIRSQENGRSATSSCHKSGRITLSKHQESGRSALSRHHASNPAHSELND